jgi:biopolymer transport protein ExbD
MNLRRRPRTEPIVRLPLAAMIDVALFVLMYFIMVGSLVPAESHLTASVVAERRQGGGGSDLATQVVRIELVGQTVRVRLGERVLPDRLALQRVLEDLPKEQGIVVRSDDDAPVYAAAAVLQAITDAGFTRVSYIAGVRSAAERESRP